jgi:hypothetical protein
MVCGYAHIVTPDGSDLYQLPAQITLAMGTGYAWPGVYQQAVQAFPSPALGSQNVSSLGSISLAGTTPGFGTDNPIWLGFSKVAGSQYGKTLGLQGTIAITKVG